MISMKRRLFIKSALSIGAGLACSPLISAAGDPWARADGLKDEKQKEKLATYVFNFSSPYHTAIPLATPHAHREIKEQVEAYTQNKVYVNIHDRGINGIGSELSKSVAFGISQGALLSVSNLAPMAPEVDILNIPFWCAKADQYLRLFKSQLWKSSVLSKTKAHKIQVLFPYVVGARTATSTKRYGKLIRSPEDFIGIRFRIPGSKSLALFYEMTGATPLSIPWKHCAKTAQHGRYDALDPAVIGLYSGPGNLKEHIGIISELESVHDGWVAIGNTDFIDALDSRTRTRFLDAFQDVQVRQVALYQRSKAYCTEKFSELGTRIYTPTPDEKKAFSDLFGHTNPAWDRIKTQLLGKHGIKLFQQLYKIARG